MAGKNFPTNKEDVLVPTYYLDIDGLAGFWAKAKQYINNQNLSLNGQNIPLYPRGTESNISITDAITDIKNQCVKYDKATTTALGLIKVGTVNVTEIEKATEGTNYYPVNIDSDGLGYVALPSFTNNAGSITNVLAGNGLTGGASSGEATLNVGEGEGISVTENAVSLKTASDTVLGGIKVGENLSIDSNGVLSAIDKSRVTIEYSNGTLNMSNVNETNYNAGTLNLTL